MSELFPSKRQCENCGCWRRRMNALPWGTHLLIVCNACYRAGEALQQQSAEQTARGEESNACRASNADAQNDPKNSD